MIRCHSMTSSSISPVSGRGKNVYKIIYKFDNLIKEYLYTILCGILIVTFCAGLYLIKFYMDVLGGLSGSQSENGESL